MTGSKLSFWPIATFLVLAVLVHLAFPDFYLLGTGQTRIYITAQELLLTGLFALILARAAFTLVRAERSSLTRAALILLFLVTAGSVYWGIKIVLYPFEADTIEGNHLLQGVVFWDNPALLYPDPEHNRAVAYMYPPLSGILFGSIYRFTGRVLFYARLLNFCLIWAAGILLTRLVRMDALRAYVVFSSWLCLQIFLCGYLYSLRSDGLLVFLLALACYLFRRHLEHPHTIWIPAACGAVLFLGAMTKQHALFVLAGMLTVLLAKRQYRAAAWITGVLLLFAIPATLWLNAATGGWFLRTALLGTRHKLLFGTLMLLAVHAISAFIFGCGIRTAWLSIRVKPWLSHPEAWLYCIAAWYFIVAALALVKGGPGSMNNFAFEFAILLPAACAVVLNQQWGLMVSALLLVFSLPWYAAQQPFAPWLVYAPAQARDVAREIASANGPVLLSRRQEFLLRTGRPVFDDLGDTFFEFVPAGFSKVADRVNSEIRSGKYALIMLEPGEVDWLDNTTRTYLSNNYDLSDDPSRALFQDRLRKRR
jgi:hypothetical protein